MELFIMLIVYFVTVIVSYLSARAYCIKTGTNPNGTDLLMVVSPILNLIHLLILIDLYDLKPKISIDKEMILKKIFLLK